MAAGFGVCSGLDSRVFAELFHPASGVPLVFRSVVPWPASAVKGFDAPASFNAPSILDCQGCLREVEDGAVLSSAEFAFGFRDASMFFGEADSPMGIFGDLLEDVFGVVELFEGGGIADISEGSFRGRPRFLTGTEDIVHRIYRTRIFTDENIYIEGKESGACSQGRRVLSAC